ncbi:hypothetical protein OSCI_2020014 [Kamptonema sp. PCC 6506]|nr:hypothetical protein OSCI_2020014 [Kamptonema sp. PCC 6506]
MQPRQAHIARLRFTLTPEILGLMAHTLPRCKHFTDRSPKKSCRKTHV